MLMTTFGAEPLTAMGSSLTFYGDPLGEMEEQRFRVLLLPSSCRQVWVGEGRGAGPVLETQHWRGEKKRGFSEDLSGF